MQNVVIIGASGHGNVVLDCLEKEGKYNFVGFVDSFKEKGTLVNGHIVLGSEFDLPDLQNTHQVSGGIVAIGDNWTRTLVVERIKEVCPEFNFISVIHPGAQIGKNVDIGVGTAVMPGVTVNANTVIGSHCILNTNASLDHDSFMYNFSSLAPNVCTGGNLILGVGSAVCLGSNIIENITIGEYSVVGAGSLVVGNIENNVLAYGTPARVIRKRIASEPYLSSASKKTSSVISLVKKKG